MACILSHSTDYWPVLQSPSINGAWLQGIMLVSRGVVLGWVMAQPLQLDKVGVPLTAVSDTHSFTRGLANWYVYGRLLHNEFTFDSEWGDRRTADNSSWSYWACVDSTFRPLCPLPGDITGMTFYKLGTLGIYRTHCFILHASLEFRLHSILSSPSIPWILFNFRPHISNGLGLLNSPPSKYGHCEACDLATPQYTLSNSSPN